jgi:hypothetical protein
MVTKKPTPERLQHQLEELRTLGDQIRLDLPLAKRDRQGEWKDLEPHLPDPTKVTTGRAIAPLDALDPLIEALRRFRNCVRHDAGTNRTLTTRTL